MTKYQGKISGIKNPHVNDKMVQPESLATIEDYVAYTNLKIAYLEQLRHLHGDILNVKAEIVDVVIDLHESLLGITHGERKNND